MIEVTPCRSRRDLVLFEEAPIRIHASDPHIVPPYPGSVVKFFRADSSFRLRHGELFPFLARQGKRVVGRIAAILNRTHNRLHQESTGFFGFFDFVDDRSVADALVAAATCKLRDLGMSTMRGPYNPTVNDECGLLVEGFEERPFIMMPYNPPYYVQQYAEMDFLPRLDLYAFHIDRHCLIPPTVERIVKRVRERSGVTLRPIDVNRLEEELHTIKDLYNATLERNWGFVPISDEDALDSAKELRPIVRPEMLLLAEKECGPVGFSLCIPNINEFLCNTSKLPRFLRRLLFAYRLLTRTPKETRLVALGVHPDHRNTGIVALIVYETMVRGREVYCGAELSWVEEGNRAVIRCIETMGARRYKTYRVYERGL